MKEQIAQLRALPDHYPRIEAPCAARAVNAYLRAHVNWRYESKWWADYVHNLGTEQTPDNKLDASLTYDADSWTLGAWVKNATNKAVIAATAAAGIPGPATAYLEDPRTYGVRVTVKY